MNGQWIALDVYFFAKPFPLQLHERFGPTGPLVFLAFLCACKRNRPQGQITFASEPEALHQMRLEGLQLMDGSGDKWTLDEFFAFTGRHKQTRKNVKGHVITQISTHFWRWQRQVQRDMAADRQRRSRARKGRDGPRDSPRDSPRDATVRDIDSDSDIPQTPSGGEPPDPPTHSRSNGTNPRARGTNPRNTHQENERTPIPDWAGNDLPEPTDLRSAIETFRANLTPPPPPQKQHP